MSNIYDMTYLMHGCLESDTRHLDRAVVGLIHFIVFGAVQHFFGSRVAKEYTEFRCMGLSKSIEVSNIPIVEDCHSPGFDVGITFGQSIHSGTFISGCYRGVRFAEISHFQIVEPLRRDRLSVSGGELVNLSIRRNILRLVFRSVFASFLYMASRSFPGVTEFDLSNYWLVIFQLQQSEVADPQPGPLILMKLVDGSFQCLGRVPFRRLTSLFGRNGLAGITCLGFSKCISCNLDGISRSFRSGFRGHCLSVGSSCVVGSNDHQRDTANCRYIFKRIFPQWRLVGSAMLSLSIKGGWWNLRSGRRIRWGAYTFLIGCTLWGYSISLIMRWWLGF